MTFFANILPITLLAIALAPAVHADDREMPAEYGPEIACKEIKSALHALASAEHKEALALDLASDGGSTAIVAARLSDLLDRSQDLRVVLKRARHSKFAREAMLDQCTRMGFRALVISEKLSSDVELVLFGNDDDNSSLAAVPPINPNGSAPEPAPAPLR